MFRRVTRVVVEVVPAAVLVFGLLNIIESVTGPINVVVKALVALTLGVVYMILLRWLSDRGKDRMWIRTTKPIFAKFYTNWYKRDGALHLFCTDVHWLEQTDRLPILSALSTKGDQVHLYVRDDGGEAMAALRSCNVNVHLVPAHVQVNTKFSMRVDENHREIIIRSKVDTSGAMKHPSDREEVRRFTDEYMLSLATEFLDSLRHASVGPTAGV